jgi:hypothetical protein
VSLFQEVCHDFLPCIINQDFIEKSGFNTEIVLPGGILMPFMDRAEAFEMPLLKKGDRKC